MAPRRRSAVHSASRSRETELLARSRALAEDPAPITPICDGDCVFLSPVKSAQRALPRVHAARDDEAKLNRLAKTGNDLARAYAATLLLAHSGQIPYIAEVRLPGGESVPYVARGKAKPLFLAGVQNHHDRGLRLLALAPWVKKRGIHVFSADRGLVCTGARARPPRDFVAEEMDELGLLERSATLFTCGHEDADRIVLSWHDAEGIEIERCASCSGDDSTLAQLMRHMAGPKLLAGFDVRARLVPVEGAPDVPYESPAARTYLAAQMSDSAFVESARSARVAALRALPERLYVAGTRGYGSDIKAFLDALDPTPAERRALEAGLAAHEGPVVLEKPSAARALADLWPQHGRRMLEAATGHAATADEMHVESITPEAVADLLRRASREGATRAALEGLPRYERLPAQASAADAIARAHRSQGREAAVRAATERASGNKAKGVALAFLRALDAQKGQEWRFSGIDQETADAVQDDAARLLACPAESYHEALCDLSRRAGESADFSPR